MNYEVRNNNNALHLACQGNYTRQHNVLNGPVHSVPSLLGPFSTTSARVSSHRVNETRFSIQCTMICTIILEVLLNV